MPLQPSDILKRIRRIEIHSKKIVDQGIGGSYHSVFKGRGMEFSDVREYTPGDDVRALDWNVTARAGAPFIKVFVEERELTVVLLVDASASLRFGSRVSFKNELAAEVAAILAFAAQRNNDRVGLLMATDRIERYLPPRRGHGHALRILREMLYLEAEGKGSRLDEALRYFHNIHRRRAVVFVLSDFLGQDIAALERTLKLVGRRHDVVCLKIGDPLESDVPSAGLVDFRDPETGELVLVNTSSRAWRRAFAERVGAEERAIAACLRRARVDFLALSTHRPYAAQLARFMRERVRRGARRSASRAA